MKQNLKPVLEEKETFVQVKDVKLFAKIYGEKRIKPAVILDLGYGDYSKAWDLIIPEIAR
ncbi:hypothetical protein D0469_01600 [Peribacillus saganii]|uniref:Uncharacterized protein n=1 Tax=Peribacillus saganii TaxID=2303992 RepID=A0A372LTB5_9BACI|nr:hypothetical protein [Peribacillus saganii]RFU71428.1 hypothetical protein D0469_01600 [Peribacillus saganii]